MLESIKMRSTRIIIAETILRYGGGSNSIHNVIFNGCLALLQTLVNQTYCSTLLDQDSSCAFLALGERRIIDSTN
jgi:hypothetical protein